MSANAMSHAQKVTVDRAYFEALLRRADFHTTAQVLGRPDPTNVSISKVEYDSLLRTARELEALKNALIQGGVTEDNLDLLISNAAGVDNRKDSGISMNGDEQGRRDTADQSFPVKRSGGQLATFNLAPGSAPYQNGNSQSNVRVSNLDRQTCQGLSPAPDDHGPEYDDDLDDEDDFQAAPGANVLPTTNDQRTLYFTGFAERTSYKDLLSVIKGGKLLSVNLRPERCATVTFLEGAAEFLAWVKRNDIYLNSKRIEVKWADHQFRLNSHICNKIESGATRNILIRFASEKDLTESQIRADLEHIHNLVVIDVKFQNRDAYVSTNSVHNALFARTCMMSRKEYKGCKIEFFPDECDVALPTPARSFERKVSAQSGPTKKKPRITNRFDMLNVDSSDCSSDRENRTPTDGENSDGDTIETTKNRFGINLNFLDSEST